jgi:hypothetical protein
MLGDPRLLGLAQAEGVIALVRARAILWGTRTLMGLARDMGVIAHHLGWGNRASLRLAPERGVVDKIRAFVSTTIGVPVP